VSQDSISPMPGLNPACGQCEMGVLTGCVADVATFCVAWILWLWRGKRTPERADREQASAQPDSPELGSCVSPPKTVAVSRHSQSWPQWREL